MSNKRKVESIQNDSEEPINKKRKLDTENIDNDKTTDKDNEKSEEENPETTDSNESEYSYDSNETSDTTVDDTKLNDCMNQTNMKTCLDSTEIVKKMRVPSEITDLISHFAYGGIVWCPYCKKEWHIDNFEDCEIQDSNRWHFGKEQANKYHFILCKNCDESYRCDYCQEWLIANVYECDECGGKICNRYMCEDRHTETHEDRHLGLTEADIESRVLAMEEDYYGTNYWN